MVLDRLLVENHDAAGLYFVEGDITGIAPVEIAFRLAYEAITNLGETTTVETDDPTQFMSYRAALERIGLVVFNNLRQYWSERGVELDEQAKKALLQDGSLRMWWSDYKERKG